MPPLLRSGPSSYIAFFVVLQAIGALKLDTPPAAAPNGTVIISWSSNSSDPSTFNIVLNCSAEATYNLSSVQTSSDSVNADMPSSINNQNKPFPLLCELQANTTDNTVLDQVPITVNSVATSTNIVSSQPSITSTSPNISPSSSSMSPNTSNSTVPSGTPTTSKSETSGVNSSVLFSGPSTAMSTSQHAQSSASAGAIMFPSMSTSSTGSALPSTNSPSHATAKPIGAIIGGVIGGLLGLLVFATLLFLFLRRSQRRHPSHFPSLMPDVKSKLSTVPFSTNKAPLTAERGTPFEPLNSSAAESQHNHSGSSSVGHDYLASQQVPDDTDAPVLPMRFSESLNNILVTIPAATPTMEEDTKEQHTDHSSILEREPGPPDGARQLWNSSPRSMSYKEINQSSSDVLNIREMDEETRKQRRDALLQQMQRVLDGEQSV